MMYVRFGWIDSIPVGWGVGGWLGSKRFCGIVALARHNMAEFFLLKIYLYLLTMLTRYGICNSTLNVLNSVRLSRQNPPLLSLAVGKPALIIAEEDFLLSKDSHSTS